MGSQPTPKRFLDKVRDAPCLKHYSYRTEQVYVGWITRYILFLLYPIICFRFPTHPYTLSNREPRNRYFHV